MTGETGMKCDMNKDDAIAKLELLIKEGETVLATSHYIEGVIGAPYVKSELFSPWRAKASIALHELLPESQQDAMKDLEKKANDHTGIARQWQGLLQGTLEGIQHGFIVLEDSNDSDGDIVIEQILDRFPDVVASINRRHAGRDVLRSMMNTTSKTFSDQSAWPTLMTYALRRRCPALLERTRARISISKTKRASLR